MHTRLVVPATAQLSEKGALSEDTTRKYFKQIVSAVSYCHEKTVYHRDLKLENILLTKGGESGRQRAATRAASLPQEQPRCQTRRASAAV